MAAPTPGRIEVVLDYERETVNTVRFFERGERPHVVKRVYVQKADLARIGSPRSIRVTIEAG